MVTFHNVMLVQIRCRYKLESVVTLREAMARDGCPPQHNAA